MTRQQRHDDEQCLDAPHRGERRQRKIGDGFRQQPGEQKPDGTAGEVVAPEEISTVAGPAVNLPKRKIAVVGAGLSGLAAAYELNGLGYDVIVFEARPRVGGRVVMFECLGPFATVRGQTCEPNV